MLATLSQRTIDLREPTYLASDGVALQKAGPRGDALNPTVTSRYSLR
jgi:hypothetical protein